MPKAAEVEEDAVKRSTKAAEAAIEDEAETIEEALQLPQEWARFYARRFRRDVETMQALTRCRTPADWVDVWTEATRDAIRDYQDGAAMMIEASVNGSAGMLRANGAARHKA